MHFRETERKKGNCFLFSQMGAPNLLPSVRAKWGTTLLHCNEQLTFSTHVSSHNVTCIFVLWYLELRIEKFRKLIVRGGGGELGVLPHAPMKAMHILNPHPTDL